MSNTQFLLGLLYRVTLGYIATLHCLMFLSACEWGKGERGTGKHGRHFLPSNYFVQSQITVPGLNVQCLKTLAGSSDDGSSTWLPAIHMGDLDRVLGSWLWPWPSPSCCRYLECEAVRESTVCLSKNSQNE